MMEKGFTLIEVLIYIALFTMASSAFVFLGATVSETRNKSYTVQEVQANNRMALDIIGQKIRGATGVNTGASMFGSDPGVLSLSMADGAKNPTIISLDQDNGTLRITEGVGSPVEVTSNEVSVENLVFTNLTDGDRENVKVEITSAYANPGDVEFTYSQAIETAVSVRQ